jgi:ketosteroid isomerase-like protein
VATPEHVAQVITSFCAAETDGDREAWLALLAPDASLEEVGSAPIVGVDRLGAFFDATVAPLDLHLYEIAPPIVLGDEALAFFACHVGHGADRLTLDRIVDHFVFDAEGRIRAVRAFADVGAIRADPQ